MLENSYPPYRLIDMETWPRRDHFRYYTEAVPCGWSVTARVDVTDLLRYVRREKKKFYAGFLYAVCRAVNSMDEMKMMFAPEGGPGVWEKVHPNFTVFHKEDETFSDLWMEYTEDFSAFMAEFDRVVETWGDNRGIKARPDQPANFFCVSCIPWLDFEAYSTSSVRGATPFPLITFGKYTKSGVRFSLPITLSISHASADGFHAARFFERLQWGLRAFGEH